jgi:proteic killer suppression protein
VIRSFKDKDTERIFYGRVPKKLPNQPDFIERAQSKLKVLERVNSVEDLRVPPGNRLEALKGDRKGQWSIAINRQWRICFEFDHDAGDALNVEVTDYH